MVSGQGLPDHPEDGEPTEYVRADIADQWIDMMNAALARAERAEALLASIKWKSIDKDNMEFSAVITCWQMDAIREATK